MDVNPSHRLRKLDYSVLQQCMHCGMCLPECPTYQTTGMERNSPRGRISLMRAVADGELDVSQTFSEEMYYCLGCLACVSACPAGVDYKTMLESARADIEDAGRLDTLQRRFWRWLTLHFLFLGPRRLRIAGRLLWLYQVSGLQSLLRAVRFGGLLSAHMRNLERQTPRIQRQFSHQRIAEWEHPPRPARYRVGLLTGCVQDLAFSDINRDTADVLLSNHCSVFTPRNQGCCGSLLSHNGELERARMLARRLIDLFPPDKFDAILSNAGGCGSHLKHFGPLLAADSAYAESARQWDLKLKDIHEWLAETGPEPFPALAEPVTATYHPSCHLGHGQGIHQQPGELLKRMPGLTLVALQDADVCCGSAGIYNITQPAQSKLLQERKANCIRQTQATVVLTANPGCHLQLQNATGTQQPEWDVMHPVSLMARAYRRS